MYVFFCYTEANITFGVFGDQKQIESYVHSDFQEVLFPEISCPSI